MKRLSNLHVIALALVFTVFAGTSVFAADSRNDRSNALNESGSLLPTQDFKALADIPADAMNETELDEVQGKYTPNPECYPGCLFPPRPFPWPWPVCLSCPLFDKFRLNQKYFEQLRRNPLNNVFQRPVGRNLGDPSPQPNRFAVGGKICC